MDFDNLWLILTAMLSAKHTQVQPKSHAFVLIVLIFQGSKSSVLRLISDFFPTPRTILEISVNLKRNFLWWGVRGLKGLGRMA